MPLYAIGKGSKVHFWSTSSPCLGTRMLCAECCDSCKRGAVSLDFSFHANGEGSCRPMPFPRCQDQQLKAVCVTAQHISVICIRHWTAFRHTPSIPVSWQSSASTKVLRQVCQQLPSSLRLKWSREMTFSKGTLAARILPHAGNALVEYTYFAN